jgi:flavin-dependent thymidylate synthase
VDVILAGFNIDREALRELEDGSAPAGSRPTPETVSAAYARISRNPRPVNELRRIASGDVEKARRSNRNIVFDMGHSSIAEHAVFNIDILGVSRLAVEFIEGFRLASYTEKSQRYIRLDGDFVVSAEIRDAGLADLFIETVNAQNALYRKLLEAVLDLPASDGTGEPPSFIESAAKEDARYILSLATESQLGMTANARTLELMIRRAAAHPLAEVREFGQRLYDAVRETAPSLIRYTDATNFDRDTPDALKETLTTPPGTERSTDSDSVVLVHATPDGDNMILASLMQRVSGRPLVNCLDEVRRLSPAERESLMKTACSRMESYDAPLREFETADLVFEVVISASCFAQMKRHRMATIISRDYDPALGATVPETIINVGMEKPFRAMIERTNGVYERLRDDAPGAAAYILTNAHRRRVIVKMNVRELYHVSRLREDRHAQWDIRHTARRMVELAGDVMPLSLMFAGGKDAFQEMKRDRLEEK